MKTTCITLATFCIGMMLVTCQKNDQISTSKKPTNQLKSSSVGEIDEFFANNRTNNTQTFTVNAQAGGIFTGLNGTQITVNPDAFLNPDASLTQGNVTLELLENYNRADLLFNNMVTESLVNPGVSPSLPITTGGAFEITLKNELGEPVTATAGSVVLLAPGSNTGGVNASMTLWNGVQSPNQTRDVAWQDLGTSPAIIGPDYSFPITSSAITNIDSWEDFLNWMNGTLFLRVGLPTGFNNTNTEIFVAFDGQSQVLVSLDKFVPAGAANNAIWTETKPYFSSGQAISIIAVSSIDGVLRSQIQPFTMVNNNTVQLTNLVVTTPADLKTAIDALP